MPYHAEIETPRLLIRRPEAGDAEAIFLAYASDPMVTRYMAWPTHRSVEDTRAFLTYCDTQWTEWPASAYQIIRRVDGRLIGGTGLDFASPTDAETGYVLAVEAWGQGYASEALGAMVALAKQLGVSRLTAGCHPEHTASIRVLEKQGFRLVERVARNSGFPNLEAEATQDRLNYLRLC